MNLNILIITLISLIIYWRIRNVYYNYLSTKYKYELYKLRDKARRFVIDGKIKENSLFFEYFDNSVCLTITALPKINLLTAIFLNNKHKNDSKMIIDFLVKETKSNAFASELFSDYGKILIKYFAKKHYFLRFFSTLIVGVLGRAVNMKKNFKSAVTAVENVRIYPETSASYIIVS